MRTTVKRDFSSEDWEAHYRRYQATLADNYLIPALAGWNVEFDGRKILEVGCGNGGCGAAFVNKGCRVVMMDIDERLVAVARDFNSRENVAADVYAGDIFDANSSFFEHAPFDIVMFRDVIEHLDRPVEALAIVREKLSEDGRVFVVFPPYYSPFGAHQQILPRKKFLFVPYNKLPFIQLLPKGLFLSMAAGTDPASREVARLSDIRLTLSKFEKCVAEAGLRIEHSRMYLSRPSFALRYGIPVIDASILGKIPFVNELFVTAGYYLLKKLYIRNSMIDAVSLVRCGSFERPFRGSERRSSRRG